MNVIHVDLHLHSKISPNPLDMEALEKHVDFNPAIKLRDIDKEKSHSQEGASGAASAPPRRKKTEEDQFDSSGFAMFDEQAPAEKLQAPAEKPKGTLLRKEESTS